MRGRWWWWETGRNTKKNHLWLAFECEGGGGGGRRVGRTKMTTFGSRLNAREVVEWAEVPQAGCWLEEAGRNADDGLTTYRMCLRIGHVVVVDPITCTPLQNGDVLVTLRKRKTQNTKKKKTN